MKLHTKPRSPAELHNTGESTTFTITTTAKSFQILSSGLYSDKIRAFIRELSNNAYDSHKAADKEHIPFTVHLPNKIEPWFSVRDYGLGLCHEDVMELYTTYFESTKTDSNLFNGALGLGSKSPFCYTENFTVTSWFNGEKRTYSAYINETGFPDLVCLSVDKYNDGPRSNGVEVQVPVSNSDDYYTFRNTAMSVLQWFETPPEVEGDSSFRHKVREYKYENIIPGAHLVSYGHRGGPVAIMSNVSYPISFDKIPDFDKYKALFDHNFEIHFENGDLDFAASREELSYIPLTIETIKARFRELAEGLKPMVEESIAEKKTRWEKVIRLRELMHDNLLSSAAIEYAQNNSLGGLVKVISSPSRYGHQSTDYKLEELQLTHKTATKMGFEVTKFTGKNNFNRISIPKMGKVSLVEKPKDMDRTENDVLYFMPSPNISFIILDSKKAYQTRLSNKYGRSSSNTVFVVKPFEGVSVESVVKKLKRKYGTPPIKLLSELPAIPQREASGNVRGLVRLVEREDDYYYRSHSNRRLVFEPVDPDDIDYHDTTNYYMPMAGFKFRSIVENKNELEDLLELGKTIGITRPCRLYGVKQNIDPEIMANGNWVNFFDHLREKLDELLETVEHRIMGSILIESVFRKSVFDRAEELKEGCPARTFIEKYEDVWDYSISTHSDYNLHFRKFAEHFDVTFDFHKHTSERQEELRKLMRCYPMLNYVERSTVDYNITEYIDYMNLIDNQPGETE